MAWTSPKTWAPDELLTASDLNQYLSDNLSALYALTQGGGRKNLLHNGAMQVHQRGTSTAGITTSGYYTADRWRFGVNAGTWTSSVEADAPTGSGFRKSLKMLHTTDTPPTLVAGSVAYVTQAVEGQNLQAIKKGTTAAEQLTLSFWTKSNKTGTYVVTLADDDNSRHVAATYTVAASATWEEQSITFPADLTGAFDNDAEGSFTLYFWLLAGTTYTSGTLATTWATNTAANRAVGQTNLAAADNNYWMVTGCQLEVGSAATGYEFKDYGTELAECQRYYYRAVAGNGLLVGTAVYYTTTSIALQLPFPVTMRAVPTSANVQGVGYFKTDPGADAFDSLTVAGTTSTNMANFYNGTEIAAVAAAGVACYVYTNNASAVVALTADL